MNTNIIALWHLPGGAGPILANGRKGERSGGSPP